jgi:hypothetical protein
MGEGHGVIVGNGQRQLIVQVDVAARAMVLPHSRSFRHSKQVPGTRSFHRAHRTQGRQRVCSATRTVTSIDDIVQSDVNATKSVGYSRCADFVVATERNSSGFTGGCLAFILIGCFNQEIKIQWNIQHHTTLPHGRTPAQTLQFRDGFAQTRVGRDVRVTISSTRSCWPIGEVALRERGILGRTLAYAPPKEGQWSQKVPWIVDTSQTVRFSFPADVTR